MIPIKFSVLGVEISAVNLETAVRLIDAWVQERKNVYVCVAPVSTVVLGHDDPRYAQVLNRAAMVTPDGMPLVWLARARGLRQVGRTYGPDLMRAVCAHGCEKKFRHFLYGATEETNARLEEALRKDYPGIQIVGRLVPPFRELTQDEREEHLRHINAARPDILWVGLGSPKQDFWMAKNRGKLNVPVAVAVGAAFDFIAGTKPQAPCWMRTVGLEWTFRWACEPRRLARRYFVGNTKFIYLLMQGWVREKSKLLGRKQ